MGFQLVSYESMESVEPIRIHHHLRHLEGTVGGHETEIRDGSKCSHCYHCVIANAVANSPHNHGAYHTSKASIHILLAVILHNIFRHGLEIQYPTVSVLSKHGRLFCYGGSTLPCSSSISAPERGDNAKTGTCRRIHGT